MFFLFVIPIGLLIGFLLGGRLSGLGKLRLRWLPLVFVALVIQLLIFPLFTSTAILSFAKAPLHILSYVLLAVWIAANVRIIPIALLSLGAICNFAVLIANGGFMPASTNALQKAGLLDLADQLMQDGVYANLILMSSNTRLNFLGDILYLPKWIPFSAAFSIGDLLILLALIWLIVKGMRIDDKRVSKAA
ncbi:DUF5317 domain-containing protein [Candidatus Bipolaricaulota bacterium]|nr:DUF5317 domain-containing protein [Candidatus Bipolaricaulota bacterium]